MKLFILIPLFLISIFSTLCAQGNMEFEYVFIYDGELRYLDKTILSGDTIRSVCIYEKENKEEAHLGTSTSIRVHIPLDTFSDIWKFSLQEKMVSGMPTLQNIEEVVYYEEPYSMDWQFHDSTRYIDSILCYRATGVFKCSRYEVWYTLSLPFGSVGPWKFHHLPGTVISAENLDHNSYWQLVGVKTTLHSAGIIPKSIQPVQAYYNQQQRMLERVKKLGNASGNSDCLDCPSRASSVEVTFFECPQQ